MYSCFIKLVLSPPKTHLWSFLGKDSPQNHHQQLSTVWIWMYPIKNGIAYTICWLSTYRNLSKCDQALMFNEDHRSGDQLALSTLPSLRYPSDSGGGWSTCEHINWWGICSCSHRHWGGVQLGEGVQRWVWGCDCVGRCVFTAVINRSCIKLIPFLSSNHVCCALVCWVM